MLALVAVWGERHGSDLGGDRLAADHEVELGAGGRNILRDVAHGDRTIDGGPEAARRDDADLPAIGGRNHGPLASRRPSFGLQADAHAPCAIPDLALDALGPGEAAFLAPALLDRPDQSGLDGRRGGV